MQKWLLWTEHQYRLPPVGKAFQELGGKELCAMSEEQFRQRSPLGGEVLHAHLDIWKSGGTWCGQRLPLGAPSQGPRRGLSGQDARWEPALAGLCSESGPKCRCLLGALRLPALAEPRDLDRARGKLEVEVRPRGHETS